MGNSRILEEVAANVKKLEDRITILEKPIQEKPKIVVLCGSSRYVGEMAVCAWIIERDEGSVAMGLHLLPWWYSVGDIPDHLAEHEGVADAMDELHLRKIDLADEVFIVNKNDYIGDSTLREIEYAQSLGKILRWYMQDAVGKQVEDLLATTALRHTQPREKEQDCDGAINAEDGDCIHCDKVECAGRRDSD